MHMPSNDENALENAPEHAPAGKWKLAALNFNASRKPGDPFDEALYAAAQSRFWREVRRLGLSADRCKALCPAAKLTPAAWAKALRPPAADARRA